MELNVLQARPQNAVILTRDAILLARKNVIPAFIIVRVL